MQGVPVTLHLDHNHEPSKRVEATSINPTANKNEEEKSQPKKDISRRPSISMLESSRRGGRCSKTQIQTLIDFMVRNPDFARRNVHKFPTSENISEEWLTVTRLVNQEGRSKTPLHLMKTWCELKKVARLTLERMARTPSLRHKQPSRRIFRIMSAIGVDANKMLQRLRARESSPSEPEEISKITLNNTDPVSDEQQDRMELPGPSSKSFVASRIKPCPRSTKWQRICLKSFMLKNRDFALQLVDEEEAIEKWALLTSKISQIGPEKSVEQVKEIWKHITKKVHTEEAKNMLVAESDASCTYVERIRRVLDILGSKISVDDNTDISEAKSSSDSEDSDSSDVWPQCSVVD